MSMAYTDGATDTSLYSGVSTSTDWVDVYDTFDTSWVLEKFNSRDDYKPETWMDYTIAYDAEKKKFVVSRGLEYQDKVFSTKRSAKRFAERWMDKKEGVNRKKKPIYKQYQERAWHSRKKAEEYRKYAIIFENMRIAREQKEEIQRQEAIQAEIERKALEAKTEEDNYFERIGI